MAMLSVMRRSETATEAEVGMPGWQRSRSHLERLSVFRFAVRGRASECMIPLLLADREPTGLEDPVSEKGSYRK